MNRSLKIGAVFLLTLSCLSLTAQKRIAFEGAEGFGKYTNGGRGGKVLFVTNLNDNGPGSLRKAINAKGARIVLFKVSGTIALESKLSIKNDSITIAGQSAPGDGICLKNFTTSVEANHVIIRYLRFRLGDDLKQQDDALNGTHYHHDIIIDHCSMTWSVDECASFYHNKDFTMQWCLIGEALNNSVHEKGPHGYGGIWGGESASFHHNLIVSNNSRNPRFAGSSTTLNPKDELVDFRNNVIVNWGINSIYGGELGRYNVVGNYFKPGPATAQKRRNRILNPTSPYGKFYVADNYIEGFPAITKDNWDGGVQCDDPDSARSPSPFMVESIANQTALEAYKQVLLFAGASHPRDIVDKSIIRSVETGNFEHRGSKGSLHGLIDSQNDAGGWPDLKSTASKKDSDGDGMPDDWELSHHLLPNNRDATGYDLNKEYDNLEVYLNWILSQN